MLENLHYTLTQAEVMSLLGSQKAVYKAAFGTGNCVGCGAPLFCQEDHDNVLILADRAVVHVCQACKPKLIAASSLPLPTMAKPKHKPGE